MALFGFGPRFISAYSNHYLSIRNTFYVIHGICERKLHCHLKTQNLRGLNVMRTTSYASSKSSIVWHISSRVNTFLSIVDCK